VRQKHFSELIRDLDILQKNICSDPKITGLTYDSRQVRNGALFVALSGEHTDGHIYIKEAVKSGALALILQKPNLDIAPSIAFAVTPDTRLALSHLSANFFEHPSKHLYVIGITGTDGKSSTVWFIQQLLEFAGKASGFISTTSFKTANKVLNNPFRQSTPEAPEIQSLLHEMIQAGKRYAVVEATSHGLSLKTSRLRHVHFDVGVFTNLTHEHLEFHGSFENYRLDKANLFQALSHSPLKTDFSTLSPFTTPRFAVLNVSDPSWKYMAEHTQVPCYTYGLNAGNADLWASDLKATLKGTDFILHFAGKEYALRFAHHGLFNVENLLASLLTVSKAAEVAVSDLIPFIAQLKAVQGRMHLVESGQPFRVIVDFAHTPAAFKKLLPFVSAQTKGRLICVFGSAGERDIAKREMQGKIASEYCQLVILTDEDPRGEESLAILEDIARGCPNLTRGEDLFLIPDRREAILKALSQAKTPDTVLLLGKGHEKSIIYRDHSQPWDEIKEAENILNHLGYSSS
jgi:UDP-N-acetylmuramoyl-L-alanyl-D-glutamate--2,6-diaminopimelate ligase